MKLLYSPSIRKVVGIAVLLFILELNMIALYTYTMVDHPQNEASHHKPAKESIVRVKRIMDAVTGFLPGEHPSDSPDSISDSGSGEGAAVPLSASAGDRNSTHIQLARKPRPKAKLHPSKPHPPRPPLGQKDKKEHVPVKSVVRHLESPPVAVVIGAKCSGVPTLRQLLELHPHLRLVNETYSKFLSGKLTKGDVPVVKNRQLLLDFSTDLLSGAESAVRLLRKNVPGLKLIVMLRDPLDHCLTCYHEAMSHSEGSGVHTFDDFVLNSKGKVNQQSELIIDSTYDLHLSRWLKYFNTSHWFFLDYYQLTTQPYKTLTRLENFLRVKPFFRKDHFVYNRQQSLCFNQKLAKNLKFSPICLQSNSSVSEVSLGVDLEDQLKEYFTPHMEKVLSMISTQIYLGDLVSLMN